MMSGKCNQSLATSSKSETILLQNTLQLNIVLAICHNVQLRGVSTPPRLLNHTTLTDSPVECRFGSQLLMGFYVESVLLNEDFGEKASVSLGIDRHASLGERRSSSDVCIFR